MKTKQIKYINLPKFGHTSYYGPILTINLLLPMTLASIKILISCY